MRSSLSLLWTKQAQIPQSLLKREMCPYKTLPRSFIADQVSFPPQFSAFHPAARGISSRAQYQPYLVHRAAGGPCSAVPSKLALPPSHPTHTVYRLTFRETGCPVQLSYVLFLSLDLCGLQTHISPSAFDLLPHVVLLFLAVALWCVATMVTLVTTWCSKGAQGSPPGRCPAWSSPRYTDLVFVDLENVGGFCKPSPIVSQEPFLPHPCWLWYCPLSWSCFLPLFFCSQFPHHGSPFSTGSRTAERSFSAGYCHLPRHHHPPQERDTGASRPGQGWVPTLPWAESLVALGTAAWPQEQGYCMTSAGGVLSPPPDCTS